jgi:hypothetical protein
MKNYDQNYFMKGLLSVFLVATLIVASFSCSHKKDGLTDVAVDTASSSSLSITMYPGELALFNLNNPYKQIVGSGITISVPVTIIKQKSAIIAGNLQTTYQLNFVRDTGMILSFPIITDSLAIQNYRYDSIYVRNYPIPTSLVNFSLNKIPSTVYYQSDYLSLDITAYAGGKISGNFSMRLTPIFNGLDYGYRGSVFLAGSFKNIPLNYK